MCATLHNLKLLEFDAFGLHLGSQLKWAVGASMEVVRRPVGEGGHFRHGHDTPAGAPAEEFGSDVIG